MSEVVGLSRIAVVLTRLCVIVIAVYCLFLITPQLTHAATITVNTGLDVVNPSPGQCTLRAAVSAANLNTAVGGCIAGGGGDTIILPAGTYTLTQNKAIEITRTVTISGAGAANTIIKSGLNRSLVSQSSNGHLTVIGITYTGADVSTGTFRADDGASLELRYVVVMSNTGTPGGGVWNHADSVTTIIGSAILYNSADAGAGGGGIYNAGRMTIISSTISHNSDTSGSGGGAIVNTGALTITASTIANNYTTGNGGGIKNQGTLTVTNSTISENTALDDGGGIYQDALVGNSIYLMNDTIAFNSVSDVLVGPGSAGAGIYNDGAYPVTIRQTILAKNRKYALLDSFDSDCYGILTSQNHNFIGNIPANCTVNGTVSANISGDPKLAPLGNNGGPLTALGEPTYTHLPMRGSLAIDATGIDCGLTVDQRGVKRAINANKGIFTLCDIGAVEVQLRVYAPIVLQ